MFKILFFTFFVYQLNGLGAEQKPVWPLPPGEPKVKFVDEILCSDINLKAGLLNKFRNFFAGDPEISKISLPFDLIKKDSSLFLTCQNIPYLIKIDLQENTFELYNDNKAPFKYPIAVSDGGNGMVFITDSEAGAVYKYNKGKVKLFISGHLNRPTGIVADGETGKIYVADTGDHKIKIFNYKGEFLSEIGNRGDDEISFNFPTFISMTNNGSILVNDGLNYKIKLLSSSGKLLSSFGTEGDGPGTFSRPKDLAVDDDDHIYIVDNLFDNIQVFDTFGKLLLVIGSSGQKSGQFWSPAGIDIVDDTVYVADTFNDRIQILCYVGEESQ